MVQRSVESATQSSAADVQQSVFASVDSVPAFSASAAREQEQSCEPMPRLAELQLSSPSTGKTSPASKKKLMSMAFQVQKRRREAAAAAAAAAAVEVSSNADTVSSSDTETSPSRGHDYHHVSNTHSVDQSSVDGRQAQADVSHISEQHETASLTPATEADDVNGASALRAVSATTMPPKTLIPAKTQPASLVTTDADPDDRRHSIDDVLSSPVKLVPPVDPQHIHAVVAADIASTASDEITQADSEDTEQQ